MAAALLILVSYLCGGIPTGYWLVRRWRGIDIREHGSGNPGTANVYRVAGAKLGAATLIIDALKGYLPTLAAQRYFAGAPHSLQTRAEHPKPASAKRVLFEWQKIIRSRCWAGACGARSWPSSSRAAAGRWRFGNSSRQRLWRSTRPGDIPTSPGSVST